MSCLALFASLSLCAAAPAPDAAAKTAPPAPERAVAPEKPSPAPDASAASPADAGAPAAPMDPEVARAVERMQKFYEDTKDFEANFKQVYLYKSFGRRSSAAGTVKFLKKTASMRWDYQTPSERVFVVSGSKVFAWDKEAKLVTVSSIDTDKLSASITFLWGQGRLEREFDIRRASRPDLQGGFALELTPKQPDPRFQRVYFLLDPKSAAVKESLVVDPDGSENRMTFSEVKTNTGFGPSAFELHYPPGTEVKRMDGGATRP